MRCINCGVATQRLRRHFTSSLPRLLLTILARWLTIEVPIDANICHLCFKLLSSEIAGDVRLFGHTMVCIICGRSVRSVQLHAVERNNSMLQSLPKSHPAFYQVMNYSCHPCWTRHQRQSNQNRNWVKQQSGQGCGSPVDVNRTGPRSVAKRHTQVTQDQTKIIIAKVYHYFEQEYEELKNTYKGVDLTPLSKFCQRTALATGLSESTVLKILQEEERQNADKQQEHVRKWGRPRKRPRQPASSSEEDSFESSDDYEEQSSTDHPTETLIVKEEPLVTYKTETLIVKEEPLVTYKELADPIFADVKTEPQNEEANNLNETHAVQPASKRYKGRTWGRNDEALRCPSAPLTTREHGELADPLVADVKTEPQNKETNKLLALDDGSEVKVEEIEIGEEAFS